MADRLVFPEGFLWGSSVAAHQVEGGNRNNDWWQWEQTPGHIRHGHTSERAADWWNRAESDFALAAKMGHNSLRLSLEWSRIEPEEGRFDDEAIARYRRMLEELRAQGIEPMVCLFHFTLPQWVARRGGFEKGWAVDRFARFVERVAAEYGDLVRWWLTLNEPMVYVGFGWFEGLWPPGKRSFVDALRVARNLVRAHGLAYRILHRQRSDAMVSAGMHLASFVAHDPSSWLGRKVAQFRDWSANGCWLMSTIDGVIRPPLGMNTYVPEAVDSHDFLGFQHYFTFPLAFSLQHAANMFARPMHEPRPDASASMGNPRPDGLYDWAMWLKRFGKPIVVTENGLLEKQERERPAYLLLALSALHRAIRDGADVRGYLHWSLVDNFEWAEGYDARFGLVHVDFETQARTVKPSGDLFADIAKANAITPAMVERIDAGLIARLFPALPGEPELEAVRQAG